MSLKLLDGKAGLATQLAHDLAHLFLFLILTAITVVLILLRYFSQSIASQMETCIALVAIEHLIAVVIQTAEANLTVRLEQFLTVSLLALGGTQQFLIFDEWLQHLHSLVAMTVLEVFQHCYPHQILANTSNLYGGVGGRQSVRFDGWNETMPRVTVALVDC